ncbi:hypothetical protein ACIQMJ_33645 [Actinosynnema sp. NPDC091369]
MSDSGFAARRVDSALPGRATPLTEITARRRQAPPFELFRLVVELVVGRDGIVVLSGPVDWREPRERLPDADPARWSGPATLTHSLGPRWCCVRLDDLWRGEGEDLVAVDERDAVVPPERRAGRTRPLVIRFPQDFPLVRTARVPPEVFRAQDTRGDYAAFGRLWRGSAPGAHSSAIALAKHPRRAVRRRRAGESQGRSGVRPDRPPGPGRPAGDRRGRPGGGSRARPDRSGRTPETALVAPLIDGDGDKHHPTVMFRMEIHIRRIRLAVKAARRARSGRRISCP